MPSDTTTLDELDEGERAVVLRVGEGKYRKLLYMGLYPGSTVRVIRRGLAGNPLEVLVDDGLRLAIRRRDARMVEVRREG